MTNAQTADAHGRATAGASPLAAARAGDRRALARLLTLVERGGSEAELVLAEALPYTGSTHVVGITGAPGVGKSTLTAALAREIRERGARVAILAVDPSSPHTGGALLGDRVRMGALHGDPDVFVRSLASRGAAGGLSAAAEGSAAVLAAAGFTHVLVETVGAGQGELDVAAHADSTAVVLSPGMGDDVQALKSGILEVADVLVVNKADRDGAERVVADLTFALGLGALDPRGWRVPVLKTVATTGEGLPAFSAALDAHRAWLGESAGGQARHLRSAEQRLLRAAAARVLREVEQAARAAGTLDALAHAVAERRLTESAAAEALLGSVRFGVADDGRRAARETLEGNA